MAPESEKGFEAPSFAEDEDYESWDDEDWADHEREGVIWGN